MWLSIFYPLSHSILRILISSSISTHALESLLLGETILLQDKQCIVLKLLTPKVQHFCYRYLMTVFFRQLHLSFTLWADFYCVLCEFSSLMLLAIKFATLPWPRAKWVPIFLIGTFSCVFVSYSKSCHDSWNLIPLFYKECLRSKAYVKRLPDKFTRLEVLWIQSVWMSSSWFWLDWLDIQKIYNRKYKVMVAANPI